MFYEEKLENGVWYCRWTPDGEWQIKSIQMSKKAEEDIRLYGHAIFSIDANGNKKHIPFSVFLSGE